MITRSVLDTDYLAYPVVIIGVAGTRINPTGDAVQFAFMPNPANANPGSGDWHTGTWYTGANGSYYAQILVGPANSGVVPQPAGSGLWNVWIKVTDSAQVPVWQQDTLQLV
jgi:hypothetical protein